MKQTPLKLIARHIEQPSWTSIMDQQGNQSLIASVCLSKTSLSRNDVWDVVEVLELGSGEQIIELLFTPGQEQVPAALTQDFMMLLADPAIKQTDKIELLLKTLHQLQEGPSKEDIPSRIAICALEKALVTEIVESQDESPDEVAPNLQLPQSQELHFQTRAEVKFKLEIQICPKRMLVINIFASDSAQQVIAQLQPRLARFDLDEIDVVRIENIIKQHCDLN